MENSMLSVWDSFERRISCRAYQDRPLSEAHLTALREKIEALNAASGLHFQLIVSDGNRVPFLKLAPAMFTGTVRTYAALIGPESNEGAELVGLYGQELVILATQLGIGSCWVAGTYDAKSVTAQIPAGEKLWDVIPLGYAEEKMPLKQKAIRATMRARDRKLQDFIESDVPGDQLPEWFVRSVEAVRLGPSAVNQQPVNLCYRDSVVSARLWRKETPIAFNDLGIAKCQFQTAALCCGVKGHWDLGSGGVFHVDA